MMLYEFETVYVDEPITPEPGITGPIYDKPYVLGSQSARHTLGTYQVGSVFDTGVAYLFLRFDSGERCEAYAEVKNPGPIQAWHWRE